MKMFRMEKITRSILFVLAISMLLMLILSFANKAEAETMTETINTIPNFNGYGSIPGNNNTVSCTEGVKNTGIKMDFSDSYTMTITNNENAKISSVECTYTGSINNGAIITSKGSVEVNNQKIVISNINYSSVGIRNNGTWIPYVTSVTIKYTPPHTHSFTYEAGTEDNANTITAKCTSDCTTPSYYNPGIAIKIIASDATYTGSAYTGASIDGYPNPQPDNLADEPTIYYVGTGTTSYAESTTAPTDAGTYKAQITWGGQTVSAAFTIDKAGITPSVSMDNYTYGGTTSTPSVSGNTGSGDVTLLYEGTADDGTTYSANTAPTKSGSYSVTATVAETDNYEGGTASKDFTVAKKGLTITGFTARKVYDGTTAADPVVTGVTIEGKVGQDDVSVSSATGTYNSAGYGDNITLTIDPTGVTLGGGAAANYSVSSASGTGSISKRPVAITASDQEVALGGDFDRSVAAVTASAVAGSDPSGLVDGHAISSIDLAFNPRDSSHYTENGTISPSDAVIQAGGTPVTDNYSVTYVDGVLKVNKAASSLEKPTGIDGLIYSGGDQTLVNAGTATGGKLLYKVDDGAYSENIPEARTAGAHTVYFKVEGDADHTGIAEESLTVTIAPQPVKISGVKAKNKVYDGTKDAEFDYTEMVINGKYGTDDLTATAAGAFENANAGENKTVSITGFTLGGNDAANYELDDGQQGSTTATIEPKEVTLTWGETVFPYDGQAHVPTVEVSGVLEGDQFAVTVTGEQTEVGEYTATAVVAADSSGNYKLPEKNTTTFTISEATKDDLKKAIEDAKKYYEEIKDDHPEIAEELKKAIDEGQGTADDPNVTAEEIAKETKKVIEALEEAKKKVKEAEDQEAADQVKALIDALPKAEDVKLSDKDAIEAARKAYDALTDDQKKLISAETLKHLTDDEEALKDRKATYVTYAGEGGQYRLGGDGTLTFVFKRSEEDESTFARFVGATCDGKVLTKDRHYTATSGSVIITLAHDYLETLEPGQHTLTAVFDDGLADAHFTVIAKAEPTPTPKPKKVPKTGDSAPLGLWIGLILLGMIGLGGTLVWKAKKHN